MREITSTARRVSHENLGERIALEGPADELLELADTFDGMLARLDAAFANQRTFAANAAHALRTPLAVMRIGASWPRRSTVELMWSRPRRVGCRLSCGYPARLRHRRGSCRP
jgi:signal transduction histidine kinase